MTEEIEKAIEELNTKRAMLLQAICEDDSIWQPQIILQIVAEIRTITMTIKMLKGDKGRFEQ